MKISKPRMALKVLRLMFWRIIKRKWYLPEVPEITVDHLAERLNSDMSPLLLDLRDREHFDGGGQNKYDKDGHIKNAMWIPFMELSSQFEDLPKDKEIVTICPGGGMSLIGAELMTKAGFKDVKSLKGGIWEWAKKGHPLVKATETTKSSHEDIKPSSIKDKDKIVERNKILDMKSTIEVHHTLDVRNFLCPIPVLKSKKKLKSLKINQVLEILTTDPGSFHDIPAWVHVTGQELLVSEERSSKNFRFLVRKLK